MGYLVAFYIFSIYMCWKYTNIAHNKGGLYYGEEIDKEEFVFIFIPIANSVFWIVGWFLYPPKKRKKKKNNYNKFFKIK